VAHQDRSLEQVALDHQGIEAGHVLLGLDPPQNQDVLDCGSLLIHGAAFLNAGARP
jgi:hypothetical protein